MKTNFPCYLLFQISFQEFKNKLLEPGLVDHIDVSNKSVAKVYVRSTPKNQTSEEVVQGPGSVNGVPAKGRGGQYKYYFNIGSVESFEEKLEEAQEALGVNSHDYVPVTYVSEMIWYQELLRFAPTLLLLGTLIYGARRMQGGLGGVGGPGGKGGRGIFNIGKAQITRADKNSKNKVRISVLISLFVMLLGFTTDLFSFLLFGRYILKTLRDARRLSKKSWNLCISFRIQRSMKLWELRSRKEHFWLAHPGLGRPF